MKKQALILSLFCFALFQLQAQNSAPAKSKVQIEAVKEFPKSVIDSVKKRYPGTTGPGKPITGSFFGGHVAFWSYDYDITPENQHEYATGSVVKSGLIPNIKPIWDICMRDAVIILGGDGNYYLTGSTGRNIWSNNDGVELYRSKDLKKWDYVGLVWSIEKDGGWEKSWRTRHNRPVRSVWAPELHYIRNNYYIAFSMPPGGIAILKSTTGKPEGPYVHATNPDKPLLGGIGPLETSYLIDPTLFEDDDHKVYFSYGGGSFIARMKDDLSDFAEPLRKITFKTIDTDSTHHSVWACKKNHYKDFGYEGVTIFKRNGVYYLGSTDHYQGRYSMMMASSKNIYGPYEGRYEAVPCNGGTNFFKTKKGEWFTCFFGDDNQAPWREKPGIIKVVFDQNGKIKIADKQPDFILNK
ncbi:MAG: family 43 glycosylhydrolase [Bacteroidales bacterium]